MTFTFHHPQLLLLLLLLPLLVLLWYWRGMRTVPSSLVLRLLAVTMLVLALANPTQGSQSIPPGPLVILVDQSDSLTAEGQATLRVEAERLAQELRTASDDEEQPAVVLWFGRNVVAPGDWRSTTTNQEAPAELVTALDPAFSDLAEAIRTARDVLAPSTESTGEAGHIVLLSDGIADADAALIEAEIAAEAGLAIDTLPLDIASLPDLRITNLRAPQSLHVGEQYNVQVTVQNGTSQDQANPVPATLRLWEGEQLLEETRVDLTSGENRFTSGVLRATNPGVARLRAEIVGPPDTFERNNAAGTTALVAPPPRVLLVEARANSAGALAAALWSAGIESEIISADRMPTRLSQLASFDGMVLIDVPSHALTFDQMTTVQEFVRSEGNGLVVTGGANSFGLGAYADTPLEQVLPVDMDAPPRPQRSDVALLLIIDRSASMDTAIGVSKFDMAKEAAILSTETLQSDDTIGVLAFDTGQDWTVPFQSIGAGADLKQIQDSIATLPTGGGTDIYNALNLGLIELQRQQSSVRHVVLLTDGRSFTDDRDAYRQLAEGALTQDITISTIAIGFDSDTELLDQLAQWGGGRYYFADDPEDIPRLTLQESEIARSDPSVEGTFRAQLADPHPLLRDFAPADLPQLDGYVATTSKDAAEVVLVSSEDDPVLASWQYGLGRAIAWTPSAADPWANAWLDWGDYGRFWAQVVRYTLPEGDSGPLQVYLTPQPGGARLIADAFQANGDPLDLANAAAQVTLPDGTARTISLQQVAPGRYVQDLLLPNDGPYGIAVTIERNGEQYYTEAGYVQEVPAEYAPDQQSTEQIQGAALLERISDLTGGQVLEQNMTLIAPDANDDPEEAPQDMFRQAWMWLLGAALGCWLLEIAIRRGLFVRDA